MELKNKLDVLEHDEGEKSQVVSEVVAKKKVAASSQKRRVWSNLSMG